MISHYLNTLYGNCKALKVLNQKKSCLFFEEKVKSILKEQKLSSENDLFHILESKPYEEVKHLLKDSKYLLIFYLTNSLNEYNNPDSKFDELGRYKFVGSIIKGVCIDENVVLNLIKSTVNEDNELKQFFSITSHQSYFYLSHDIDSVNGSLLQDSLWAIRNHKIDVLLKVFFDFIISKPHWLNFDLIMKTESFYDFKSTFYWLVNKGKIDSRQTNSDYSIHSKKIVSSINTISENGFENGLHKSISNDSLHTEISKMPIPVNGNRYHYLKFKLPGAYHDLEKSGLKLDASLGFADHYGFRNGYGYPFHPYNSNTNSHHSFLEVPLNIMDGTFQRYMKIPVDKTASTIIDFLEKNSTDSLISILWHNTFFSNYKYKGYLGEYKKILEYLYEMKFQNINQSEIITQFSWTRI